MYDLPKMFTKFILIESNNLNILKVRSNYAAFLCDVCLKVLFWVVLGVCIFVYKVELVELVVHYDQA